MMNLPFPRIAPAHRACSTALALLSALLLGCCVRAAFAQASPAASVPNASPQAQGKPALSVTTTQPLRQSLPVRITANGSVVAWQEAIVGTEVAGLRLTEVRVDVGDSVRAGDVLAVFAADTVRAELAQARAALAEAQAALGEAAANAQRARSLQGTEALSAAQMTQYLAAEQGAQARVASARAQEQLHEVRLAQATLAAPDAGVISARQATVGAVLGTGSELFRMIRQGRIEWRAEVTAHELRRITPGMRARVQTPEGTQVQGRVRLIAPTLDAQTRNALVHVELPPMTRKDSAGLKPGMFLRGSFEAGHNDALTVPQSAIAVREGFSYAYRVLPDQRVAQVKVQTGRIVGERIEIVSGLSAQDIVVAAGAGFLNDGDRVRVVKPQ